MKNESSVEKLIKEAETKLKNKKKDKIILLNILGAIFSLCFPFFMAENGNEFLKNHLPNTFEIIWMFIIMGCMAGVAIFGANASTEIEFYNEE